MERVPPHDGPETVLELLNRPEGFFAFRPAEDDEVLLVSKVQTVSLSVDRQAPIADPARLSAARTLGLEVVLAGGGTLGGWGGGELPEEHAGRLGERRAAGAARAAARLLECVPGSLLRGVEPRRDPLREPRVRPVRAPPDLRSP